jgi:hypothetical protein
MININFGPMRKANVVSICYFSTEFHESRHFTEIFPVVAKLIHEGGQTGEHDKVHRHFLRLYNGAKMMNVQFFY